MRFCHTCILLINSTEIASLLLLSCAKSHMLSASRRQPHLLHVSTVDRRQTWWSCFMIIIIIIIIIFICSRLNTTQTQCEPGSKVLNVKQSQPPAAFVVDECDAALFDVPSPGTRLASHDGHSIRSPCECFTVRLFMFLWATPIFRQTFTCRHIKVDC